MKERSRNVAVFTSFEIPIRRKEAKAQTSLDKESLRSKLTV